MGEMVAFSVISQPTSATMRLNAIIKIHNHGRLHEGHHIIPMAMEMHGAPKHDMDCFIKERLGLFHDK